MNPSHQLVVFGLDEQRYALRLSAVERVVQAAAIDPLPGSPEIVLGVVNLQGRMIPAVDIRKRFGLPAREMGLGDHLIISRTTRRDVALLVDAVFDVVTRVETEITPANQIVPGLDYIEGVIKLEDGLALIHDLDAFLSLEEEEALEAAMG